MWSVELCRNGQKNAVILSERSESKDLRTEIRRAVPFMVHPKYDIADNAVPYLHKLTKCADPSTPLCSAQDDNVFCCLRS